MLPSQLLISSNDDERFDTKQRSTVHRDATEYTIVSKYAAQALFYDVVGRMID